MNHLEKNQIDIGSIKKYHKEFIRNSKWIFQTQQRCKIQRQNKIGLSPNDNKRMQSVDSVEIYAYVTR